jgi:hypothetical protein
MSTQFITNDKGEKTAVIIPLTEYEDLLHHHHLNLELADEYKNMIDWMLKQEDSGKGEYVSYKNVKDRFPELMKTLT